MVEHSLRMRGARGSIPLISIIVLIRSYIFYEIYSFSYTYKKIKNNKLKNKEGIMKYSLSLSIIYRIKKNDKLVK